MTGDQAKKIVEKASDNEIASIAEVFKNSGDFDSAVEVLEAAVKLPSPAPGIWHNLGLLRSSLRDYPRAVKAYTNAIDAGYPSWVNRGFCFEQLGDWDSARADYLLALHEDPADADALVDLGTMELALGNVAEATLRLVSAAKIDTRANWQLADAYIARGDIEKARKALWEAIAAGEARAFLDLAELEIGRAPRSSIVKYFGAAIDAGAQLARRQLAIYLDNDGDSQEALKVALEGVELGDTTCYAPLAVIYESQGQVDLAIKYYRLAIADGEDVYVDDLEELLAANSPISREND